MRLDAGLLRMSRRLPTCLALILLAGFGQAVWAQAHADKAAAETAEDRAQKQADRVFTWIKFHNEATTKKQQSAAPAAATPAAAAAPAKLTPAAAKTATAAASAAAPANRESERAKTVAAAVASVGAATPATNNPALPADPASAAAGKDTVLALAVPQVAKAAPAAEVEEEPQLRLVHKVEPELPRRYLRDFSGGTVLLRFVVQKDGTVKQAEAMRSTHNRLSEVAIAAVSQWRFEPIARPREGRVEVGFRGSE